MDGQAAGAEGASEEATGEGTATPTNRASGTRQSHPEGGRRDVVATRAARLFAERGYLGASLRDIAAASGIQSPTLYSHYPSKLSILVEVVGRYFDAIVPRLENAAGASGDGAQRLRAMVVASVEVGVRNQSSRSWSVGEMRPFASGGKCSQKGWPTALCAQSTQAPSSGSYRPPSPEWSTRGTWRRRRIAVHRPCRRSLKSSSMVWPPARTER
jgi:AcrR family transcriptional regulator